MIAIVVTYAADRLQEQCISLLEPSAQPAVPQSRQLDSHAACRPGHATLSTTQQQPNRQSQQAAAAAR